MVTGRPSEYHFGLSSWALTGIFEIDAEDQSGRLPRHATPRRMNDLVFRFGQQLDYLNYMHTDLPCS